MKILYALTIILEFFTVPVFLKYYWPTKCKQSLLFKMLSATLFVICGYSAMTFSGNNSSYATLIMLGLVFGWLGDLFLHSLKDKLWHFAVGLVAFLAGHLFYIAAFHHAIKSTYPQESFFTWYEIAIVVAAAVGVTVFALIKDMFKKRGPIVVAVIVYGMILVTMLAKAFRYAIGEWAWAMRDDGEMVAVFVTVALGSLLFFLSDASLGVILASKETKRGMRIFNITTYFAAQILLASSVIFVKSQIMV